MNRAKSEYTYWDASVFLAYLNNEPGRADVIEVLLDQAKKSRTLRIATSSLTIVEVVVAANSRAPKRLSSAQEEHIDELLNAPFVRLVDTSRGLYYQARGLMRTGLDLGWSLRSKDAIHLATAAWLHQQVGPVLHIYSYDDKWPKYAELVGGIAIGQPHVEQPMLPYGTE